MGLYGSPGGPLVATTENRGFFPGYGADRETVELLFRHLGALDLEAGRSQLIAISHEVWHAADRD